jgi:hypothetical protein
MFLSPNAVEAKNIESSRRAAALSSSDLQVFHPQEGDAGEAAGEAREGQVLLPRPFPTMGGAHQEGRKSCSHSIAATVIREDGANFIFNRITSDCGDTIYSVCASCHDKPSLFVGSTAQRKNDRTTFMSLDPTNPKHFAILLSSPCSPYFIGKNGELEINAASVETVAGLRKAPRINNEGINVRPMKRKAYRRRAGILGEYALRQSHFELKLDEIASLKKTMKMI